MAVCWNELVARMQRSAGITSLRQKNFMTRRPALHTSTADTMREEEHGAHIAHVAETLYTIQGTCMPEWLCAGTNLWPIYQDPPELLPCVSKTSRPGGRRYTHLLRTRCANLNTAPMSWMLLQICIQFDKLACMNG